MVQFDATIEPADRAGAWVVVSPEVVAQLGGSKGRVPVQTSFDGHPYRGSLAVY